MLTGVGALYLRRRPRVRVVPVQSGGGQERGIRSGTVPTPLAVGLGAACELAQQEMDVSTTCYCKWPHHCRHLENNFDSCCILPILLNESGHTHTHTLV